MTLTHPWGRGTDGLPSERLSGILVGVVSVGCPNVQVLIIALVFKTTPFGPSLGGRGGHDDGAPAASFPGHGGAFGRPVRGGAAPAAGHLVAGRADRRLDRARDVPDPPERLHDPDRPGLQPEDRPGAGAPRDRGSAAARGAGPRPGGPATPRPDPGLARAHGPFRPAEPASPRPASAAHRGARDARAPPRVRVPQRARTGLGPTGDGPRG